jgi:hypothetical protein
MMANPGPALSLSVRSPTERREEEEEEDSASSSRRDPDRACRSPHHLTDKARWARQTWYSMMPASSRRCTAPVARKRSRWAKVSASAMEPHDRGANNSCES